MSKLTIDDEKKPFKSMTFKEKAIHIKNTITVEPLIAFYWIPSVICRPALRDLQIEKACRANIGYADAICDEILAGKQAVNSTENANVQKIITSMHAWQNPMENFVPLILILYLGSYSDRHKIRKPFLLLPIVGELFAVAACILCAVFMKQLPIEVQGFSQTVVPSFLGGPTMFLMALYAYITDDSTLEMRTFRIGVIQIVTFVCSTILNAFGGFLYKETGYVVVLLVGGIMYFLGLCYGFFCVKEKNKRPKYPTAKAFVGDLFNPAHAKDIFSLFFKTGVNLPLLTLLLGIIFVSSLTVGEYSVFWLFLQKVYKWTVDKISYYESISSALLLFGSAIFLPLFTKIFKLHDIVITAICFFDKIIANFVIIFYDSTVALYLAAVILCFSTIGVIAVRSLLTKCVSENDAAKVLALMTLSETIAYMLATPLYNKGVYNLTIESYPVAFLFVTVVLLGACAAVLLVCYCFKSKTLLKPIGELEKKTGGNMTNKEGEQDTYM